MAGLWLIDVRVGGLLAVEAAVWMQKGCESRSWAFAPCPSK